MLLVTNKDVDSSIVTMDANGENKRVVYKAVDGVAFAPSSSPDGEWIAFGFGSFLQGRRKAQGKIMMVRKDETELRIWPQACRTRAFQAGPQTARKSCIAVLTNGSDNLQHWSPDGSRIMFTRSQDGNFDIYTIKPDGADLVG